MEISDTIGFKFVELFELFDRLNQFIAKVSQQPVRWLSGAGFLFISKSLLSLAFD